MRESTKSIFDLITAQNVSWTTKKWNCQRDHFHWMSPHQTGVSMSHHFLWMRPQTGVSMSHIIIKWPSRIIWNYEFKLQSIPARCILYHTTETIPRNSRNSWHLIMSLWCRHTGHQDVCHNMTLATMTGIHHYDLHLQWNTFRNGPSLSCYFSKDQSTTISTTSNPLP